MNHVKLVTAALACSFLAGCSPGGSGDHPPPPGKTVFDPLKSDLDRARGVQQLTDQAAARERAAIDADGRDPGTDARAAASASTP